MTHKLVPEHRILKEEEKQEILKNLNVGVHQFPKILKNDAAIRDMEPKQGDIVEIKRKSRTTGEAKYYRVVVVE